MLSIMRSTTYSLSKGDSLRTYQKLVSDIYDVPGGRNFSAFDILGHQQRFTMRTLKGIRKNDPKKIKNNLMISLSWSVGISNRFNFNIEELVWKRFPFLCSYCGSMPCTCKDSKPTKRAKIKRTDSFKPKSIRELQNMFERIYPSKKRSLEHAGVHLAEEMGEVSEAVMAYMSEHKKRQLVEIQNELADYISCLFGVANSSKIDIEKEAVKMFSKNCYVCHKAPCACSISFINTFES